MRIPLLLLILLMAGCSTDTSSTAGLQVEKYRGQWVVINYWAQWCKPCIAEIPELNRLNRDYPKVAVLGVNYDGAEGAELAEQLTRLGVDFPTLAIDPAATLGVDRPQVLPTTLILNPEGQLVATLLGPQTLESLTRATGQQAAAEAD